MAQTIIGATTYTKQPTRYDESSESGRSSTERWEGPAAAIVSLIPTKRGAGYTLRYELDGRVPFLERTSSAASALSQTEDDLLAEDTAQWELIPQQTFQDLKYNAYFSGGVAADKEDYEEIDNAIATGTNISGTSYTTKGDRYKALRLAGTDSYIQYSYIIRYARVVGRETQIAIDSTDVNEVTAIPVPNIPTIITFVQGLSYEWLKKAPSFRYMSAGRFELVMEWWGVSAWESDIYTGGSG